MSFDPIRTAEDIIQTYSTDFIGDRHVAFRNILSRYGSPSVSIKDKIPDFIRMKGPFIQVLKGPKWSSSLWTEFAPAVRRTHAPNGIDRQIVDSFSRLGFRRLYQFQEEAMNEILDDSNALVVAGTGRGKTEAWLIPIIQFILRAKRGEVPSHPPNSVKAVLIYPTKALAQDQLKRLIKYLVELNLKLPEGERITVGVYDGDTPSDSDPKCHSYLWNAFRYFKCPMYDSGQVLCQDCDAGNGHSLVVEKGRKDKLQLMVPTPQCRTSCPSGIPIPLEFISLTRDTVKADKVDILLTNPDILNYRLINVNANDERDVFLKQPKFFVLDEVHTYSGLFGSFVSMIMKRLFQARKNLLAGEDDIRIVAASATVRNKSEIFTKIAPFAQPFKVIEERLESYSVLMPNTVPPFLYEEELTNEAFFSSIKEWTKGREPTGNYGKLIEAFSIKSSQLQAGDDTTLEASIKERMLERLTTNQDETPDLDAIRAIHTLLTSKPLTMNELTLKLGENHPALDAKSTKMLVQNFITIADLAGLLENRIHLFSWPLDGYYACVNCGKIYDTPQQQCASCHHHFVTSLAMCKHCDEEAFESWLCPYCLNLYSLQITEKGELVYYNPPKCNCQEDSHDTVRTVWRPYFTCTNCQRTVRTSSLRQCDKCGARMMLDDTATKLVCTNPSCLSETALHTRTKCPYCNSDLKMSASEGFRCISCGKKADSWTGPTCDCGGSM
ncbi:MAG: DEAD/DEAH box helicase, partial [Nitrososphaerota archaeon]|nr:DEAD/DEAH box helicase [Nitrososphaerota archaeon]